MIFLFLICIVIVAVLALRGQSRRQHREMMRAVNPELLEKMDAANRAAGRRALFGRLWIIAAIATLGLFIYGCGKINDWFNSWHPVRSEQVNERK